MIAHNIIDNMERIRLSRGVTSGQRKNNSLWFHIEAQSTVARSAFKFSAVDELEKSHHRGRAAGATSRSLRRLPSSTISESSSMAGPCSKCHRLT